MANILTEITCWYSGHQHMDGVDWEYTHFSEGYSAEKNPPIKHPEQKSHFSSGLWRAERAYLIKEGNDLPFIAYPMISNLDGTLCKSCCKGYYELRVDGDTVYCANCNSGGSRQLRANANIPFDAKLKRNRLACMKCSDIIESRSGHDFKHCSCGEMFIDGGLNYMRCGGHSFANIIDLCEYYDAEPQQCSRPQPHDGPCNGWPCDPTMKQLQRLSDDSTTT